MMWSRQPKRVWVEPPYSRSTSLSSRPSKLERCTILLRDMDPKEVDNWIDPLVLWKERCDDLVDDVFRVVDAIAASSVWTMRSANRGARRWGEQVLQRRRYVLPRARPGYQKGLNK